MMFDSHKLFLFLYIILFFPVSFKGHPRNLNPSMLYKAEPNYCTINGPFCFHKSVSSPLKCLPPLKSRTAPCPAGRGWWCSSFLQVEWPAELRLRRSGSSGSSDWSTSILKSGCRKCLRGKIQCRWTILVLMLVCSVKSLRGGPKEKADQRKQKRLMTTYQWQRGEQESAERPWRFAVSSL